MYVINAMQYIKAPYNQIKADGLCHLKLFNPVDAQEKRSPILYVLRFSVDHILLALTARPRKEKKKHSKTFCIFEADLRAT